MSLSRSPSPRAGGGWASPGLSARFDASGRAASPRAAYPDLGAGGPDGPGGGASGVTWSSAQARSEAVHGFQTRRTEGGWMMRHVRKISNSLPSWTAGSGGSGPRRVLSDKERLSRGRWYPPSGGSRVDRLRTFVGNITRKMKLRLALVMGLVLLIVLFYTTREYFFFMDPPLGAVHSAGR